MSSPENMRNFAGENDGSFHPHNLPRENDPSSNQSQSNSLINKSTLESSLNSIIVSFNIASSSNQQSSNNINNVNQQSSNNSNNINQQNHQLSNNSNNINQQNQQSSNNTNNIDEDDIKYDNIELEKREKPIGFGSYGRVYKRKEKNKEKYYAEKIVEKKDEIKFDLELETLEKFNGKENIINIIDYKENKKKYFILMEYCECDLKTYLKNNYLDIKTVQNIMRQIINGYSLLYSNDYKHYDLKLSNILVKEVKNKNLTIKISDFGFTKFSKTRISYSKKFGTLNYMAPEILLDNNFSEKADIYSIGIIAFQLAINDIDKFPFSSYKEKQKPLNEKLKEKIINEYLFDFIKGCLNPNIQERYDFINLKSNPFLCIIDIEKNQKKNQLMI